MLGIVLKIGLAGCKRIILIGEVCEIVIPGVWKLFN